jgi:N-acetylneuraminic acid mutarotase
VRQLLQFGIPVFFSILISQMLIRLFIYSLFFLLFSCKKINERSISVTNINPPSDGPGATVKIYGEGFGNNPNNTSVYFNGVKATIDSLSDSVMYVIIPVGATTGAITITVNGQTYHSTTNFVILSGTWIKKANFPGAGRYYAAAFSVNNKGYVVSGSSYTTGYTDMYEYDPLSDSWSQKASLPAVTREYAVAMGIGTKGYLIGGLADPIHNPIAVSLIDVWEYDPATDSWTQKGNFPGVARTQAAGFAIGNKGFYGLGYIGQPANDWWEYDPTIDQWTRKADFPPVYDEPYGLPIGSSGCILVNAQSSNWHSYDTALDQWTSKSIFYDIVFPFGVTFSIGTEGYISLGGPSHTWEYDPPSDKWTQKTSQPFAREGGACFTIGNKGYAGIGGINEPDYSNLTTDWWEFDP